MSNTKKLVDYDVRVRERNLKSGLLTREEVDKHLAAVPDVSTNAQTVEVLPPGAPHEEPKAEVKAEAPTPPAQPPVPPVPPVPSDPSGTPAE